MRLFKQRYDPWPDLMKRSLAIQREIMSMGKTGELSVAQVRAAQAGARSAYENFTIYATVGKDRKKLGPEWVDKMEKQARDAIAFARSLHA